MSLKISVYPGYDYRDEPGRGAHGLSLAFTALGEMGGARYACSFGVSATVALCVPADWAGAPDHFMPPRGGGACPHLGVPCTGMTGYTVGDDALRVLIEGGEDTLESWLRDCAASWLDIAAHDNA
jgi:hypothetical protein